MQIINIKRLIAHRVYAFFSPGVLLFSLSTKLFWSSNYMSLMVSSFANSSRCSCLCWLTVQSLPLPRRSPSWRTPSRQVQAIDQTFYFHAADRCGAETCCLQVCKGVQGPPSSRSPVTITDADVALSPRGSELPRSGWWIRAADITLGERKAVKTSTMLQMLDWYTVTLSRCGFVGWEAMISLFSGS